jgi:enterochelin esterase-like enzyme
VNISFPSNEFDEIVSDVCRGTVSEEQARALNVLLRSSAVARDEYLLRLELHARLASAPDLYEAAECDLSQIYPSDVSYPLSNLNRDFFSRKAARERTFLWMVGLAACFVLLAVVSWRLRTPPPQSNERPMVVGAESDWKPSTGNLPGNEYPRINLRGQAQFRIKAPNASQVAVNIGEPLTVSNTDGGVWTITTAPLPIGFHFYRLIIDGEIKLDTATPVFKGGGNNGYSSGIEIPTGEDFHERKNVPHGEVREHRYFSKTTKERRHIFVYTPPNYEQNATARFPVLYLLPGAGEDESCWSAQGRAAQILDNLIAAKRATPMIVVMEAGVPLKPGEPDTTRRPSADLNTRYITLDQVFVDDLIPMIDVTYRTIADGEHRALAGLSLGGSQAFVIGLRHPDVFANLGGFSMVSRSPGPSLDPKTANGAAMADVDDFNKRMRVLFLSTGKGEGGWMANSVKSNHEFLQARGINHVFYESPDTGHEWHTWRRSLREFVVLLFKEKL